MASAPLSVWLIGTGLVGKEVIKQLQLPSLASRTRIDLVSNSKYQLKLSPTATRESILSHLTPSSSASLNAATEDGYTATAWSLPQLLEELKSHAFASQGSPVVFVDCTSDNTVAQAYPAVLAAGVHIVTPNKKAFSSSQALFDDILAAQKKSNALVYQEATVGAGLPIIGTLKDLLATGDEITKIEGVLSGTLSYIFNEFSKVDSSGETKSFSEIVKFAKSAGYTEPHPADDLSGSDVGRKLAILSRIITSGSSAKLPALEKGFESVPTRSLIPEALQGIASGDEFVQKLPEHDAEFEELRKDAQDNGAVLRYVGVIDVKEGVVKCALESYPFSHPFASALSGSDNIIAFHTARYSARPLIVQGSGAGASVTAMGVTADILKIAERVCSASNKQ